MKIVFVHGYMFNTQTWAKANALLKETDIELHLFSQMQSAEKALAFMETEPVDIFIGNLFHDLPEREALLESAEKAKLRAGLGWDMPPGFSTFSETEILQFNQFFSKISAENYANGIRYLAACAGMDISWQAPQPVQTHGIHHPDAPELFSSVVAYMQWYAGRAERAAAGPVIGVTCYYGQIIENNRDDIDALIQSIEANGMTPLCVCSEGGRDAALPLPERYPWLSYFKESRAADGPGLNAILNFMAGRLLATPADAYVLQEMNVPVFQMIRLHQQTPVDEIINKGGTLHLMGRDEYQSWFDTLPEAGRKKVLADWDAFPGQGMVCQDNGKDVLVITGLHLRFFVILAPIWRGDSKRLLEIFGDWETVAAFYGGCDADWITMVYTRQLDLAHRLGCQYVVFHPVHCELEYVYSWRFPWRMTDTLDLCAEVLNAATQKSRFNGLLLFENLWWPGSFRLDSPQEYDYLLSRVDYPHCGIALDTGHLLNKNPDLADEGEAADYMLDCLDRLGETAAHIRTLHLTKNLSGDYIRQTRQIADPSTGRTASGSGLTGHAVMWGGSTGTRPLKTPPWQKSSKKPTRITWSLNLRLTAWPSGRKKSPPRSG